MRRTDSQDSQWCWQGSCAAGRQAWNEASNSRGAVVVFGSLGGHSSWRRARSECPSFFMEQSETTETNVVLEDVHQRVPNNYRLRSSEKPRAYESPKGARHLHKTMISQWNVFFLSSFFFFFPRFVEKKRLSSRRGYISDPKSITSRPIKYSFVKGKLKRSVLLTSRSVMLLENGKQDKETLRRRKRRRKSIFPVSYISTFASCFFPLLFSPRLLLVSSRRDGPS